MKTLFLAAMLLCGFAASANAMDDAERAREMEAFKKHQSGAPAIIETTTTVETTTSTPVPLQEQAGQASQKRSYPLDAGTAAATQAQAQPPAEVRVQALLPEVQVEEDAQPAESPAPTPALSPVEQQLKAARDQGVLKETTTQLPSTTTTEKTTTTTYTVTTRKVGLVGNRPYEPRTTQMDGGVTRQVIVNGVETANEVVKPDTVATEKSQSLEGDYYSSATGADAYKADDSNLRVHSTGRFNR